MAGQAKQTDPLLGSILRFVDSPTGALDYVLWAFPWGQPGPLEQYDGPDLWQAQTLLDISQGRLTMEEALQIAVASGHGIGKSALTAWIILYSMTVMEHVQGVVTASTARQLETKTWRELAVWHKMALNGHWFKWTASKFYHADHPETWFFAAIPWSAERSDSFAGTHSRHVVVIFDEASGIDDIIWEVAEGAMTTPGAMWLAFGNPVKNTGRFRECFGRYRHRWLTRQIDSRQAKMTNKAKINQWLEDYGEDSDFFKVRVRGEFPSASTAQFIPTALVEAAMERPKAQDTGAAVLLGVDVARFGDDQSVIAVRRGRDLLEIKTFRGISTTRLAAWVVQYAESYKADAVFVDAAGVGGGVYDVLQDLRLPGLIDVNGGRASDDPRKYANKRAEIWGLMREWLGTASLPIRADLKQDLIGVEYFYNRHGAIQLESKDDMKSRGLASPDEGDAVSMTFAAPVARRDVQGMGLSQVMRHRTYAESDYDEFV